MESDYQLYYGDIHNHNACGYGIGTLERSIDIARSHLDFFAFTGHSSWHDMEPMEGGREQHWHRGFARLKEAWPKVRRQMAEANRDGEFTAFLGFEWHSSAYGDHCVIFQTDHEPMVYPDNLEELRRFCREKNALLIPHHLAYPQGNRGVNWNVFEPECSPIVEVYSEHGNSEEDRGPYPFFNHSFGGRVTSNTIRYALAHGKRFGFYASTDSHSGFPGAYGEGLMGAWAKELSRESLFEAFRARRTCALTGDRIEVDMRVNGEPMGADIKADESVEVSYEVIARDEIETIEVIQDGRTVHRSFIDEGASEADAPGQPFQLRLEWGWGPWGDLALERIADWEFNIEVEKGKIVGTFPCWQSGPFDENRRHRLTIAGENGLEVISFTSRKGAYRQNPNQSVVLLIEGGAETRFCLSGRSPAQIHSEVSAKELLQSGRFVPTGPFPRESMLWHRVVTPTASTIRDRVELPVKPDGPGYVYLRVKQKNGQLAWASPVFINHPEGNN